MVVNSFGFLIFFLIVLTAYFVICRKDASCQNWVLLIASYVFYGIADWKMLPLLVITTLAYFFLGKLIAYQNQENPRNASLLTTFSVLLGIGVLGYFKYLNFFIESFTELFNAIGLHTNPSTFSMVMPVGVSFFTFKLISYAIEIHRGNMAPCKDLVRFSTYIAFFPTILSGPIDRPKAFIRQLGAIRPFQYQNASEGCRRILWGMFKKMCVADVLSGYTDAVFNNYVHHNTTTLIVAAVLYTFQLYADFSGYSDMAIGCGRIMGINIMENFKLPLFAVNIQEFWKRWHISLTTWLTDYVFSPLNIKFREWGNVGLYLAIVINLLSIGLWHGANWTFVLFGLFHGLCLVFNNAISKGRKTFEKKHNLKSNVAYKYVRIIKMFAVASLGFILFRSDSIANFWGYILQFGYGFGPLFPLNITLYVSLSIMIFKEWKDEQGMHLHFLHSSKLTVKAFSFAALMFYIVCFGSLNGGSFIYFQF